MEIVKYNNTKSSRFQNFLESLNYLSEIIGNLCSKKLKKEKFHQFLKSISFLFIGMMQNMGDAGTELKTLTETKINGN